MSLFGKLYSGIPLQDINIADVVNKNTFSETYEEVGELNSTNEPAVTEALNAKIESRKNWFFGKSGAQPPVTEEESLEISKQVEDAKDEMKSILNRVTNLQTSIEAQIMSSDNPVITLDTRNKMALKRALRKLFGRNMTQITLSDYKALLQARSELEEAAVLDYARDFPNS